MGLETLICMAQRLIDRFRCPSTKYFKKRNHSAYTTLLCMYTTPADNCFSHFSGREWAQRNAAVSRKGRRRLVGAEVLGATACGCYNEMCKHAFLGDIGCLIVTGTAAKPTQTPQNSQKRPPPKAQRQSQHRWRRSSSPEGSKKGHKGNFAKAQSNEKRKGERVDHILNSM
jgi:hypothetical protein